MLTFCEYLDVSFHLELDGEVVSVVLNYAVKWLEVLLDSDAVHSRSHHQPSKKIV